MIDYAVEHNYRLGRSVLTTTRLIQDFLALMAGLSPRCALTCVALTISATQARAPGGHSIMTLA
jgi:hypothetical protein